MCWLLLVSLFRGPQRAQVASARPKSGGTQGRSPPPAPGHRHACCGALGRGEGGGRVKSPDCIPSFPNPHDQTRHKRRREGQARYLVSTDRRPGSRRLTSLRPHTSAAIAAGSDLSLAPLAARGNGSGLPWEEETMMAWMLCIPRSYCGVDQLQLHACTYTALGTLQNQLCIAPSHFVCAYSSCPLTHHTTRPTYWPLPVPLSSLAPPAWRDQLSVHLRPDGCHTHTISKEGGRGKKLLELNSSSGSSYGVPFQLLSPCLTKPLGPRSL